MGLCVQGGLQLEWGASSVCSDDVMETRVSD